MCIYGPEEKRTLHYIISKVSYELWMVFDQHNLQKRHRLMVESNGRIPPYFFKIKGGAV